MDRLLIPLDVRRPNTPLRRCYRSKPRSGFEGGEVQAPADMSLWFVCLPHLIIQLQYIALTGTVDLYLKAITLLRALPWPGSHPYEVTYSTEQLLDTFLFLPPIQSCSLLGIHK